MGFYSRFYGILRSICVKNVYYYFTIRQCGIGRGCSTCFSEREGFSYVLDKNYPNRFFLFFMYLFLIEVDFIDERPSFYNTKYTDQICVLSLLQQFQKSYYQNQISNFDNAQRCVKFRKLNFSGRPNRSRLTHLLYI